MVLLEVLMSGVCDDVGFFGVLEIVEDFFFEIFEVVEEDGVFLVGEVVGNVEGWSFGEEHTAVGG